MKRPSNRQSLRSVFISDLHLGSRGCRAARLLDFLNSIEVEQLFLIGDVVDLSSLKRTAYWPASHEAVLSKNPRMALQVKNLARMTDAQKLAVSERAAAIRHGEVGAVVAAVEAVQHA